jgi:hypothetical protein
MRTAKPSIPIIIGVGAILVVAGIAAAVWLLQPSSGGSRGGGPVVVPHLVQRDTPERAITEFMRAYQRADWVACKEWMTADLLGLYALFGGWEEVSRKNLEDLGRLQEFEILSVYEPEEADLRQMGVRQVWVRHVFEKAGELCSVYNMAPPEMTGDHWRLGGIYQSSAPCR